jgi:hypothetical protein
MRAALVSPLVAALGLAACAPAVSTPIPLRPEPVAFADTLRIPEPGEQAEHRELRTLLIHGPIQLAEPLDPGEGEALNVTHDDDVVSSAWWERRMGYRPITPDELARGPAAPETAPATSGPLEIKAVKAEGVTPGFTIKDANGNTFIMKFDPPGMPHLQSAPGVISNRLMWGAGYHVPEDYVAAIDASRLVIDEDVMIEDVEGERPLTMDDVQRLLERAEPIAEGRYRVLASKYVPGIPKGPFFFDGRREDDPNDHYEHEHRREVRALWVFSSLINNTDVREGNTLDVYVKPGYLRHYVIDFGATLGSASTRPKHRKDESERPVDLYRFIGRVATLGFYKQPWEDEDVDVAEANPSLGYLRGADFSPDSWKPAWTNRAFVNMTHADAYWAAKIVAALSDEHVRAAVHAGGLPTRELEDTLSALIGARRDKIVEYYYRRVSTVEEPVIARQSERALRLSFRDLGLEQGLWTPDGTVYDWRFSDPVRGRSGGGSAQPRAGNDQLMDVSWTAGGDRPATDDLARLEIVTRRPGLAPDPAIVFLRWNGQSYQVAGITHGDPY